MAGGLLQVGERADTDTVGYEGCGAGGEDAIGGGQFPDLPSDGRRRGELLSDARLWYSWFLDGESRPVTVAGKLSRCGELGIGPPEGVFYRFSYSEDGITWQGFSGQDRIPSGVVRLEGGGGGFAPTEWNAPSYVFTLDGYEFTPCTWGSDTDGSPHYVSRSVFSCTEGTRKTIRDGAALRVEMYTFQRTQFEGEGFWRLFAKDEINLRSAIPEVTWSSRAYKIGDTAVANWEIPVVNDEAGNAAYFLTVLDLNTNTPIAGWNRRPLTSETGQARIPVTSAMFSNDASSCQNRLRAVIYTQIIQADLEDTAVQASPDALLGVGAAPTVSGVTFDKEEYFQGDTVRISFAGEGTLTKWHVSAHIGGLSVFDKDVNVTEVSFSAPTTGILEVEVTAYNVCNPSEVYKVTAKVGNVLPDYCTAFPTHPACTGGGGNAALASLILGIVLAVGGFLVFLYLGPRHIVFVIVGLLLTFGGVVLIAFAIVEIVTRWVPSL
jgi:hypothetical protein